MQNSILHYLITEYLIINKQISLPGIGSFEIIDIATQFHVDTKILTPKKQKIIFSKHINPDIQENLFLYLTNQLQQSEDIIKIDFFAFIENIISLMKKEVFYWKGIGSLEFNPNDEIIFNQEISLYTKYQNTFKVKELENTLVAETKQNEFIDDDYKSITAEEENTLPAYELEPEPTDTNYKDNEEEVEEVINVVEENETLKVITETPIENEKQNLDLSPSTTLDIEDEQISTALEPEDETPEIVTQKKYHLHYKRESDEDKLEQRTNNQIYLKTEFLDTELSAKYNVFQKIFIIAVLIASLLYLFFHLFLNDFSFHSFSE